MLIYLISVFFPRIFLNAFFGFYPQFYPVFLYFAQSKFLLRHMSICMFYTLTLDPSRQPPPARHFVGPRRVQKRSQIGSQYREGVNIHILTDMSTQLRHPSLVCLRTELKDICIFFYFLYVYLYIFELLLVQNGQKLTILKKYN